MPYLARIKLFLVQAALALSICCVCSAAAGAERALKIGMERNNPPFSFEDKAGNLTGFNVDVADAVCVIMERRCEFLISPLSVLQNEMREGRLDLVMGTRDTAGRAEYMDFSSPYFRARFFYVGKPLADEPGHDRPARIGVRAGGALQAYLEETNAARNIIVADEMENIFAALKRNELDMMLVNSLQAYAFLSSGAETFCKIIGSPLPVEATPTSQHIGMRKGDGPLAVAVNDALREIRYNGVFMRINRIWFPHTLY